jgi:hypothetical protein
MSKRDSGVRARALEYEHSEVIRMEHEDHTISGVIDPVCGMTIALEDAVWARRARRCHLLFLQPVLHG